jgi:superfamily II DNA or RNA helicase
MHHFGRDDSPANTPTAAGSCGDNLAGDLAGTVAGDVAGDVPGTVAGDVAGDVPGTVAGDVAGSVAGLTDGLRIEFREYQLRIARKALQMFQGTHRDRHGNRESAVGSVMIESPTGSGKTVMGLMVARYLQRRLGLSVGWVAMRRNLLAQAERENRQRGFDVEMKMISMFDKDPPAVDLLVIDEAQHDAAMSMANLHCQIKPRMILGMTATPFRTDRIKLCFDKVITDAGIHQLIQDGFLSRYHHYTIPAYEPRAVAEFYMRHRQRWGKSLIFFHRQQQCDACHEHLRERGIHAEVVTSRSDRQRQLSDFESGRIDVLLNMAILTEGFDCPDLQTVFCRPSGKSCTIQMAGRVLRKHAPIPFKQVVQCRETRHPLLKTAMADEQYVWMDDSWRTLTLNRQLAAISNNARRLVARSRVELPAALANHRDRLPPWHQGEL